MFSIPSHIRALIFDLDGTLADTMPIHIKAWQEAGRQYGVDITQDMINRTAGRPTIAVVDILNEENGWSLIPKEVKAAKDIAYEQIKKTDGVTPIRPVFDLAKANRGILPMAIGTGSTRPRTEDTLTALGKIQNWFGAIVTADDVVNFKPSPDTYLQCAKGLSIAPEYCLVFEDAEFGLQAARTAGMSCIDVRDYLG